VRLILLTSMIAILAGAALADPPKRSTRGSSEAKKTRGSQTEEKRAALRAAAAKKRAELARVPVTPQREKLALGFARKYHRELADLLSGLKSADRTHYENAVREVARDADRIEKLGQRDRERSLASLRIWKYDSRIRLEAARFSMNQSEETEKKLRRLMAARQKARIAFLKLDRDRAKTRHQRLDEQIDTLATNQEERITAEIDRLRKGRDRLASSRIRLV
jgi:hypothetical protein